MGVKKAAGRHRTSCPATLSVYSQHKQSPTEQDKHRPGSAGQVGRPSKTCSKAAAALHRQRHAAHQLASISRHHGRTVGAASDHPTAAQAVARRRKWGDPEVGGPQSQRARGRRDGHHLPTSVGLRCRLDDNSSRAEQRSTLTHGKALHPATCSAH